MKNIILPFITLLFLFSCSTGKEVTENTTNLSSQELDEKSIFLKETQFDKLSNEDSLFASINKGFCFGTCPVYTMEIYKDGFVTYKGTRNVDLLGEYTTRISYAKMLEFVEQAKMINYMELNDVYDKEGVTDLPSITTSIVLSGKTKTVKRRFNFPNSILTYEKLFEELMKNADWQKVKYEK